jgi:hypothetical protein
MGGFGDRADAVEDALFEIYAALELNAPYNVWETY